MSVSSPLMGVTSTSQDFSLTKENTEIKCLSQCLSCSKTSIDV